jgi:hypothetical protein
MPLRPGIIDARRSGKSEFASRAFPALHYSEKDRGFPAA